MARVVRIRRSQKHGIIQGCDVYIGRECRQGGWDLACSKWANPFTIKSCGGSAHVAVSRYKQWLTTQQQLLAQLSELEGKVLGCWCKKPGPCHGDVLVELLNARLVKVDPTQTTVNNMGQRLCLPASPPAQQDDLSAIPTLTPVQDGTKSNLQTALQSVGDLIASQEGKIQLLQKLMDAVEADVQKRRDELKGAPQMAESRKDVLRATLNWHMQKQMEELTKHELLDNDVHAAVLKHIQSQWEAMKNELLPTGGGVPPLQPPSMKPSASKG